MKRLVIYSGAYNLNGQKIMKKSAIWGYCVLIAVSATACNSTEGKDDTEDISMVTEAVSDLSTQTDASVSVASEDDEAIADIGNLPDELEEGEVAMTPYDQADIDISGSLPDTMPDLEMFRSENADVCSYIVIPGTAIDEAVLKKADSNEYYLDHNFLGESDSKGCIFMDMGNETDYTDPVTCLYARSGDGEPFGELINYLDPGFMQEHQYIYVYSNEYVSEYRIFAAYSTEDQERLLVKYNFYDYAEYQKYVNDIFSMRDMSAVVKEDLLNQVIESWNILTLEGIDEDGDRLILQGVFNGRVAN